MTIPASGCNFEDQVVGSTGLYSVAVQAARLKALRDAATKSGVNAFINARKDVFLKAPPAEHTDKLLDEALERGRAYADAGASGLFLPGLLNEALIAKACAASNLPVNIMMSPAGPTKRRLAQLGVARVSHGPGPWRLAMKAFQDAATAAIR